MTSQWYVANGGKHYGPFTSSKLKALAAAGKVTAVTQLRMGSDGQWVSASAIKGLFTPICSPPVALPQSEAPHSDGSCLAAGPTSADSQAAMIIFHCPHCSRSIRVGKSAAGKRGTCHGCGQLIRVPQSGNVAGTQLLRHAPPQSPETAGGALLSHAFRASANLAPLAPVPHRDPSMQRSHVPPQDNLPRDLDGHLANPYAPPLRLDTTPASSVPRSLPVFCTIVFVIDLVLCSLRTLLVLIAIPGYMLLKQDHHPLAPTAIFEILAGAGIVLSGIPANIGLLLRRSWGVPLAYASAAATLLSIIVGAWQANITLNQFQPGSAELIGGLIGGGAMLAVRLGILGLFVMAVALFAAWKKRV